MLTSTVEISLDQEQLLQIEEMALVMGISRDQIFALAMEEYIEHLTDSQAL